LLRWDSKFKRINAINMQDGDSDLVPDHTSCVAPRRAAANRTNGLNGIPVFLDKCPLNATE